MEDKLYKQTYTDQITDIVKGRIITGRLVPGEKINTRKLEAEFQLSGAPIRDALQRLVQQELVVVRPRVGYYVRKLTREDNRQVWGVRKLFERYGLAESIHRADTAFIDEVYGYHQSLGERDGDEDYEAAFDRADELLHHHLIVGTAENPYIAKFYDSIYSLIQLTRHLTVRYEKDLQEHFAILDAFSARDMRQAEEALSYHLDQAEEFCDQMLRTHAEIEVPEE